MIPAEKVHETLARFQLTDGYGVVFDLERSHGSWLVDAKSGKEYLDAYTCFASWPIGYNHPQMAEPAFRAELGRVAACNPSNADLYSREMAGFVETFAKHVTPAGFPHHFWISGGALAVENALKVAFDWKARKLGRTQLDADVNDLVILHFKQAFHGRSGYTLSLTNTVPDKIGLFPKFPWPRVHNPAIEFDLAGQIANDIEAEERKSCAEIEAAFQKHRGKVAAIVLEPLQGEGGDNHFRTEFLRRLRRYADEEQALLVLDEVQTGFFGSGKPWYWQHHDVAPDVVAFGKKSQICGIYAGKRVDEVADNVFQLSSRINSTWGGSLTDMVRSRRIIEIIIGDKLAENVLAQGKRLIEGLRALARAEGGITNVRGIGSLCAFTLAGPAERDALLKRLFEGQLMALKSGPKAIRFRLPLTVSASEVDEMVKRVGAALPRKVRA
ncbi:MAG: L-lysine 6-transaminase [Planctomycetes bacterium]|nr:L-lysine 6-transaminase [Planctomycetota bacterium]